MALAEAVKAGVGLDPARRADHMFSRSGLTEDQFNHIYGFVCDPKAVGPSESLDPRKILEAALRFYDKPCDVDQHRDSSAPLCRCSRPLMGHAATVTHRHQTSCSSSVQGLQQRQLRAGRALERREFPSRCWLRVQRLGRLVVDLATVSGPKSQMTGKRKLTSKPTWHVEGECCADQNLYEAC